MVISDVKATIIQLCKKTFLNLLISLIRGSKKVTKLLVIGKEETNNL